jgi:hypothetical protein
VLTAVMIVAAVTVMIVGGRAVFVNGEIRR